MLETWIIYPTNQSEWASRMAMQPKKHDPKTLHVCVQFRWFNRVTLTNPFPTPFVDEMINEVASHEFYSFIDGFLPTIKFL